MSILIIAVSFMNTSCAVTLSTRGHAPKGWFKNSNNPHHPNSTNPGHNKEKKNKGKKNKNHHEATFYLQ